MGAGALAGITTGPAEALSSFHFDRFSGTNRFDTARLIALQSFGHADTVLLATGRNFPDALAANYLAGHLDVPILLTEQNALPHESQVAMEQLGVENVTLLGGTTAISAGLEGQLRAAGLLVDRIDGANRYATALSIAKEIDNGVGVLNGERTAFVASGATFADALAAGPIAYSGHFPVLLTPQGGLGPEASQGLTQLGIQRVILLGGLSAISQAVEDQIRDKSVNVTRIAGADRTETATAIAEFALGVPSLGFTKSHVNLARGDQDGMGADALAGGPHAGRERAPILLAAGPNTLDTATLANTEFLFSHIGTLANGHVFGGTGAISDQVRLTASYAAGLKPQEAPAGQSTPTVFLINLNENYFVSTAGRTYEYGAGNDSYQLRSTASNLDDFERVLNTGDVVTVNYNPVAGQPSSFNVTDDRIEAPGKPTVTVAGGTVTIFTQESNLRSIGTAFKLQRAAYALPACLGPLGAFVNVADDTDYDGFFTDNPGNGCYVYRVVAYVPGVANASTAFSEPTGNISVPQGNPDTVRPRILDLRLTDAGSIGTADGNDVHTFTFSERMSPNIAANGATYRLSDPDGTTANVICGTNATCTRSDVLDGSLLSPQVLYSVLTVRLTGGPQIVSAGANSSLQYPATIVPPGSANLTDAAGNVFDPALSDVTLP